MQVRFVLPLIAFAGLAACSSNGSGSAENAANVATMNEQQRAQAEHRAPDPDKVMSERWQALFGQPDKLVAALNDMGYKVPGYAAGTSGYTATGQQVLPADEKNPPATVKTNVVASGTADTVQTITFTFDTHVSGSPDQRRVRDILGFPRQIVNGVLQRFEVGPGDPVVSALTLFHSAKASSYGTTITVDATPGNGDRFADQHIVVTISRAGDAASAA